MEKVILVIRDGWGYRKQKEKNAIAEANTPVNDMLMKKYSHTLLNASGEAVGLPPKYQGNSEVGHMTIGSGRIIYQSLARINKAIETKDFFKNKSFLEAIQNCKENNSNLHIIGLLQQEGVHSHINHLLALLELCKEKEFENVKIHLITDGRDAPVTASLKNLELVKEKIVELGIGEIVSISGRFYAMDRDKRWDRTEEAYKAIVQGKGIKFTNAKETIKKSHEEKITDEFILPRVKEGYTGIDKEDSIIFYNFRTDRTRQLTQAIVERDFTGFERKKLLGDVMFVGMTNYYKNMKGKIAFSDMKLKNLLGEVVSEQGKKQLRISETEKYAHVTFFFNGQCEEANKGEERILVPSPKVKTYDEKPEMSVYEITDKLVKEINKQEFDFVVVNLVNCDMVGHTGMKEVVLKAVESVDESLGKIVENGLKNNYTLLVLADHGNAEDQTNDWNTSHTTNKVPFILVSNNEELKNCELKKEKGLQDVAPTVLKLLEIKQPKEMTGESIC